jgi:PucR C-terminal helix-turn-helix domain/GGDEF-like domain
MLTATSSSAPGLQRLVDSLADRLGRPVVLDDIDLRPLAHSPQRPDEADRVRTVSILSRQAPPEAVTYLRGHGVGVDAGPDAIRVPRCTKIGLQARFCQPVSREGETFGFLWIVEGEELLGGDDTELVGDIAQAIADEISRRGSKADELRLRAMTQSLLSDDPAISCDAAASLLDAGTFPESAAVAALVGIAVPPAGERLDDTIPVLLSRGLHAFERQLPDRRRLTLTRGEEAVALIGNEDSARLESDLPDLAESLREELARVAPGENWEIAVGIGSAAGTLAGAPRSYGEAAQAATVAARVPQVEQILSWGEIGIYRLLVPPETAEAPGVDVLPTPIQELLSRSGNEMLLHTLETYLDLAGDAQATTAALFLARGSLYYRLHRIEEIAGVDLRSGHDRLMLHLGLKLARILRLYPTVTPAEMAEAEPAA